MNIVLGQNSNVYMPGGGGGGGGGSYIFRLVQFIFF